MDANYYNGEPGAVWTDRDWDERPAENDDQPRGVRCFGCETAIVVRDIAPRHYCDQCRTHGLPIACTGTR